MQSLVDAAVIVCRAEAELRQLLVCAAEKGDYAGVHMLADWANQLKCLVEEQRPLSCSMPENESAKSVSTRGSRKPPAAKNSIGSGSTKRAQPKRAKSKRKSESSEYPKFVRQGDDLVKIGWSKRQRTAYRHKAPKRVIMAVARALEQAALAEEVFAMDRLFPIRDPEADLEVPTYQAYLVLAWLRKENLITQHGRKGYSLPAEHSLTSAVEHRWEQLPNS